MLWAIFLIWSNHLQKTGFPHIEILYIRSHSLTSAAKTNRPTRKKRSIPLPISIDTINYFPFSAMSQKKQSVTNFRFVTERFIFEHHHQLTRSQFERMRADLPKFILWVQPSGKGGRVLWNLPLFLSVMATDSESPQTMALTEEYLSTLPTAA